MTKNDSKDAVEKQSQSNASNRSGNKALRYLWTSILVRLIIILIYPALVGLFSYLQYVTYNEGIVILDGVRIFSIVAFLIGFFGLFDAIAKLQYMCYTLQSILLIKKFGLQELADKEYPTEHRGDYQITQSFAWSFKSKVCIPLIYVDDVSVTGTNYVNSLKSHCGLTITTKDGKNRVFLHYGGSIGKADMLKACALEIKVKATCLQRGEI